VIKYKNYIYRQAGANDATEAKMMLDSLAFPMEVKIVGDAVQISCASDIDLTDACKNFFADFVTPIVVRYKSTTPG
jgi:hypothetical protein